MSLPNDTGRHSGEDALLSSVLRAAGDVEAGSCPDAEVIGLFAERALAGAELRAVEAHVEGCPRCQATVAAFVRALPDEAGTAEAGAAADASGPAGGAFGAWFAGWRWLVPATSLAAVALVAVWVGRGPADQVAESARGPAAKVESDAAPVAEPAPSRQPEAFVPEAAASRSGNADSATAGARAKSEAPAQARSSAAVGVQTPRQTTARLADREAATNAASGTTAGAARSAATNVAPADARAAAPVQEALSVAEAPATPTAAVPAPAPAPAAAPARAVASEATAGAARPRAAASAERRARPGEVLGANDVVALPLQPAVSFRLRAGAIERSADRGATWQLAVLPAGVTVVAFASPAPGVCWAVARDAVLRATDGATFTREPVPTSEHLTGITATDAMRAVVTTTSGAHFATANGGRTWAPAP
ncbi:MAG: zf-HC2 domain-containing protein [Acidobacteria bacterium]|nr:zf-HC2 domain-containing protein [Acidobacteriota bacterium]